MTTYTLIDRGDEIGAYDTRKEAEDAAFDRGLGYLTIEGGALAFRLVPHVEIREDAE